MPLNASGWDRFDHYDSRVKCSTLLSWGSNFGFILGKVTMDAAIEESSCAHIKRTRPAFNQKRILVSRFQVDTILYHHSQ
jgi:hypothetical protein